MMLARAIDVCPSSAHRLSASSNLFIATTREVLEDLDPLVVGVGHIDAIGRVDEHARRQPELAGPKPALAKGQKEAAAAVEDLDGVEEGVDDIDMPLAVERHALRHREVAGRIAMPAERRH